MSDVTAPSADELIANWCRENDHDDAPEYILIAAAELRRLAGVERERDSQVAVMESELAESRARVAELEAAIGTAYEAFVVAYHEWNNDACESAHYSSTLNAIGGPLKAALTPPTKPEPR